MLLLKTLNMLMETPFFMIIADSRSLWI